MNKISKQLLFLILTGCMTSGVVHGMHRPPDSARINKTMRAARDGNLQGVALFLKDYPDFWNYRDDYDGSTLTHKAAGYGKMEVLEFLLSHDENGRSLVARTKKSTNDKQNYNLEPLDVAREYKQIARLNHDTEREKVQHAVVERLEAEHRRLGLPLRSGGTLLLMQSPASATSSSTGSGIPVSRPTAPRMTVAEETKD